ncbi:hypothetical protein CANINC_003678 [Pichia inconspicua]|uniref:CTLH/CRA C-terminal to LisH motif domain-containing protein n=1 Tax=Pichia inconspicua TaxID=52247 RepID=A0A4T0WY26_9ASCO|nr:hypothetical protein CANINC_003678 [[Candida] inconspicua]
MELIKNPDYYIQFKYSEFKIPIEILKKNYKNLQKQLEKHKLQIRKLIKLLRKSSNKDDLIKLIDLQKTFNNRINSRINQHNSQIDKLLIRIDHIKSIKSLYLKFKTINNTSILPNEIINFYKFENYIMIINFLLYKEFNLKLIEKLAQDLGVSKFIDFEIYNQLNKIKHEIIINKNLKLLKLWCLENKDNLILNKSKYSKFIKNDLIFETNLFEYIELIKSNNFNSAILFARENIHCNNELEIEKFKNATSLFYSLNYQKYHPKPNTKISNLLDFYNFYIDDDYREIYSKNCKHLSLLDYSNWLELSNLFELNFKLIYGLNLSSSFISILNIGISAVKTKACCFPNSLNLESQKIVPQTCPICSSDFGNLPTNHPFSFQSKSNIFEDPVLHDKHIFSFKRLVFHNRKLNNILDKPEKFSDYNNSTINTIDTPLADPILKSTFNSSELRKVYPT